jgi:glycosyltransferase involved in cell wall biosynthesis
MSFLRYGGDPMKVAIDAGPLYGHRTGVGEAASGLIEALEARTDVEVAPYLVSRRSTPRPGHRRLPVPGIVASHLWSRGDRPSADRWMGDAELVHGTNYVAPPTSLPTVVSVYDCWFLQHPGDATPLVRRAGDILRRAVDRGAWIHTSSTATEHRVRELLATDRVVTITLGPPVIAPQPDHPPGIADALRGTRFVVAIGTEERRKGLPLLVSAFGELTRQRPDVHLVLAGAAGDDGDAVTAAIEALPDATRVHRLGPVDDVVKAWLLRNASVLAYPSTDEGFGFPILEAQLTGSPVVATAVGSIPEVAGDGAILVDDPGRSPTVFAAALDEALSSGRRLGLIEAGYRNAKRFDWAVTAERMVELYRTVIDAST